MDSHLQSAVAELHTARLRLQCALVAVRRAMEAGESADGSLRVIDAELRGTTEEAAVFGVLLDQIRASRTRATGGVPSASARRRAAT